MFPTPLPFSPRTFKRLWKQASENLDRYRSFPRLAGGELTFWGYPHPFTFVPSNSSLSPFSSTNQNAGVRTSTWCTARPTCPAW